MLWGSSNKRDLAVWPQTEQLKVYAIYNVCLHSATLKRNNAASEAAAFHIPTNTALKENWEKKGKKQETAKQTEN